MQASVMKHATHMQDGNNAAKEHYCKTTLMASLSHPSILRSLLPSPAPVTA